MVCVYDSELCTDLLSQIALTPTFKHWELGDIERAMLVDVQQSNLSPHGSEFFHVVKYIVQLWIMEAVVTYLVWPH